MPFELKPRFTTRPVNPEETRLFDRTLAASWAPCWLQSSLWGDFKSAYGWEPHRLLLEDSNGSPAGGIQLLRRRLGGPVSILYAPRGPFLLSDDPEALRAVLAGAGRVARALGAPLIKLDPEWPVNDPRTTRFLDAAGLRDGGRDVQHRATMLLDLGGSEEELLSGFKSVCRYSIRLAERRGVTVEVGSDAGAIEAFLPLMRETAARQEFVMREEGYYRRLAEILAPAGALRVLLAKVGEEVVGGAVMVHFGHRLHYLFGGSRPAHRELKPNYLLHWRAIQDARAAGLTEYDMWGSPADPREGERGWGYYVFKSKFNCRHVSFPGMLESRTIPLLGSALHLAESLVRRSEPEFA